MRRTAHALASLTLLATAFSIHAQAGDAAAELQKRLNQQFPLTKFSSDKADIVGNPGAVLVLQKDNLLVYSASVAVAPVNNYKNGKLSQGFGDMLAVDLTDGLGRDGGAAGIPKKKLVAGQKFWLAASAVQKDKVVFAVITDPYDDGRYFAQIRFPFPKGNVPSADDILKTISEVVTVQPSDNPAPSAPSAAPPPMEQAMAPIAPPPPPADTPPAAPKTISLGQTKDQVVALFGQPRKVVQLGPKEIVYYPDMKVTFVAGKVSDVE